MRKWSREPHKSLLLLLQIWLRHAGERTDRWWRKGVRGIEEGGKGVAEGSGECQAVGVVEWVGCDSSGHSSALEKPSPTTTPVRLYTHAG